ncbi:hypothetical protein Tco_0675313, partial [Tanacetum coccineum]
LLEQAPRSPVYVPEDHVPVYIPEPDHLEDLVPAEDEALVRQIVYTYIATLIQILTECP